MTAWNDLITKRFGTFGAYLSVAAFGTGSRLASLGAQFIALFVLTRLMTKSELGDLMTVFAGYRILSFGIGTGCMSGLLYHVARDPTDETEIRAHRSFALVALLMVVSLEAVLLPFRHEVSAFFGKPGLAGWLVDLAPFCVFSTLIYTATGAMDGRQWINQSILVTETLPNLIRLLLLLGALSLHLPIWAIGASFTVSVALPYLGVLRRLVIRDVVGWRKISRWDAHYSLSFIGHSLLSMQLQGVDMLVVSYLFSSEQAADFAIAGRIAVMFPFFQQIVFKKFLPRSGQLIAKGDYQQLEQESRNCRSFSVISVSGLAAIMMLVAPYIVFWAGNFTGSLGVLVALAAPPFARAFFAGGDAILRMSGAANFSVSIMFFSFLLVVLTPFALGPWLHIFSVPLGMTLSAVVLNPIIAWRIHRSLGFWLMSRLDMALMIAGLAGIALAARWASPEPWRWVVIGGVVALPGILMFAIYAFRALNVWRDRNQQEVKT